MLSYIYISLKIVGNFLFVRPAHCMIPPSFPTLNVTSSEAARGYRQLDGEAQLQSQLRLPGTSGAVNLCDTPARYAASEFRVQPRAASCQKPFPDRSGVRR